MKNLKTKIFPYSLDIKGNFGRYIETDVGLRKLQYLFPPNVYLQFERGAEVRHEYIDGEIYEVVEEGGVHEDICVNLIGVIGTQLKGKSCCLRAKHTKVRSGTTEKAIFPPKGMFSYPDLVVICGEVQHHDDFRDVVTNPKVIIEVLSDSTAKFDREIKFQRYQKYNDTLTDYILVSQDQPLIEHYIRQADGGWLYYIYEGLERSFKIDSVDCKVLLTEVYDRIVFGDENNL
jgi:Uma2 family endonuclease